MTNAIDVDHAVSKNAALFITTLASFLTPFGISSVNIALPSIGKAFSMDAILLSWVTTVYLLTSAMFLVPFGKIADIYGIPNANAVMSSVESRSYGVASGTLSTMRITGMAFSTGVALLTFSIYLGKVQITSETYPVFLRCIELTFAFFTVLCFGGVFVSLAKGDIR